MLNGGIGNQLFSYSAARRLSIVNGFELIVDNTSGFERDYKYRRQYQLDCFNIFHRKATRFEKLEPFSRVRRKFIIEYNKFRSFKDRRYIVQNDMNFNPELLQLRPSGNLHLSGYWQSEKYFKDIEHIIRNDLTIVPPTDDLNIRLGEKMSNYNSVAIHVRFFESINNDNSSNVTNGYYENAIKEIQSRTNVDHYFIFSFSLFFLSFFFIVSLLS